MCSSWSLQGTIHVLASSSGRSWLLFLAHRLLLYVQGCHSNLCFHPHSSSYLLRGLIMTETQLDDPGESHYLTFNQICKVSFAISGYIVPDCGNQKVDFFGSHYSVCHTKGLDDWFLVFAFVFDYSFCHTYFHVPIKMFLENLLCQGLCHIKAPILPLSSQTSEDRSAG